MAQDVLYLNETKYSGETDLKDSFPSPPRPIFVQHQAQAHLALSKAP